MTPPKGGVFLPGLAAKMCWGLTLTSVPRAKSGTTTFQMANVALSFLARQQCLQPGSVIGIAQRDAKLGLDPVVAHAL